MSNNPRLNPNILDHLHKTLVKPEKTIRNNISLLKRRYPNATLNAVAQIYAEQHDESVRRLLHKEDKLTIPLVTIEKAPVLKGKRKAKTNEQTKIIIQFDTTDLFLRKHITEINRAYNKNCYTCVFVLTRKVFENLIVGILKSKYPKDPTLYLDVKKKRYLDFSVVLGNLYVKRNEFDTDRKNAIDRLNQKLKPFKDDANDKVHSLYHIVENAQEIDNWNIDTIMALIKRIM